MEPGNGAAAAIDANHPLGSLDHPAWRIREALRREAYAEGVREVSGAMVGAVESLLQAPVGDDSLRTALTMLCEAWRAQNARRPAPTIDAQRAQSAAELLDQFLTALDTWATEAGATRIYSMAELRWFAAHWLPSGEIPRGTPLDLELAEDAQCTTMRAAVAHIDRLTRIPWADADHRNHPPTPHRCACRCSEYVDPDCSEHGWMHRSRITLTAREGS